MFISTFLFLSVFYFYCYYLYLISQQCSSWSPESSAKSQQCSSLPGLCSPKSSSHVQTALCPYAPLCITTELPSRTVLQSVSLLSLPLVRSHLGTYDGLAPYLVRDVVCNIKYITIECITQSSTPGIEHQIECARHIPTPIVLQSPYQQNLTRRVSSHKTGWKQGIDEISWMKVRKAVNNCFMDFVREKCGETGSAISLIELLAIYLLQFWTNCCTNLVPFFVCQIWVITNSKSATNITWTFWMRNWGFVSPIFLPIFFASPLKP